MGGLVLVLVLWEVSRPPPGQAQGPHVHIPSSPCPYTRFARRSTLFEMYWTQGPLSAATQPPVPTHAWALMQKMNLTLSCRKA